MKSITVNLENKGDIRIIPFSDLHIGSNKCNLGLIKSQIEKVKADKNCYAIIVGDLVNNSTRTSVGDVFAQPLSPMEQMKLAIDLFSPIKDRILAITSGNHERRSYKDCGTDLGWFFAKSMELEDRYDYCAPLLRLRFGNCRCHKKHPGKPTGGGDGKLNYYIYITHGDGANGSTVGGKANSLNKRGLIVDADVIITGHTHQPLAFTNSAMRINRISGNVDEFTQTFVNCASTLGYEEYAELKGMKPSSNKQPEIILHGNSFGVDVLV